MPTQTFTVASGADDAQVTTIDTVYPTTTAPSFDSTTAVIYTTRYVTGGSYLTYNALFRWDTSVLPDSAIVTDATLSIYFWADRANADSLSMSGDWGPLAFSSADYRHTPLTNAFSGYAFGTPPSSAFANITLSNPTNVNLTGYTYQRLHISQRAADAAPTGLNYQGFGSYDNSPTTAAQLIVTYSLPTSRLAPDAILAQTNLTGAVSAIQDDPDSPDANWLTAP